MRDLIDRAKLLKWMERIADLLDADTEISDSYANGYRNAMQDVKMAASVKVEKAE